MAKFLRSGVTCLLLVSVACAAHAASVVLDFESLTVNTTVADNYHSQGVTFLRGSIFPEAADLQLPVITRPGKIKGVPGKPLIPHSGAQVADISQCHNSSSLECEFFVPAAGGALITTASRIEVWVGSLKGSTQVTLTAFDLQHHSIGSSSTNLGPGGAMKPLIMPSATSNIAYFEIVADISGTVVVIDDLTVETSDGPQVADFWLAAPSGVRLRQGSTVDLPITINRTNGSSGSVWLTAAGLPEGLSASFTPTRSTPTSLPEQAKLTLTAAPDSALNENQSLELRLVGSPLALVASEQGSVHVENSGAGPAPRRASIALNVVPSFNVQVEDSTGIPPCGRITVPVAINRAPGFLDPVDLRIDNLPPGVTGAFDSPSVGPPPGGVLQNLVSLILESQPGRADNEMVATLTITSGALPRIEKQLVVRTAFSNCGLTPGYQASNRGCLLGNTTPEWVSVDPSQATRRVEGLVVVAHTNEGSGDDMGTHYSLDVTAQVELDPPFAFMNSERNEQHDVPGISELNGHWLPPHRALTMALEWEKNYFDERYRPAVNDRAVLIGRWIYDCGHPDLFQTEIHPPHFAVFIRPEPHTFAGVPGSTLANVARAYAYGRGSALKGVYYYSVADRDLPEFAQDYQFEIPLPSRPSKQATPIAEVVELTFGGPAPTLSIASNPDRVLVTYPLAAYLGANPDSRAGAVIAAGWFFEP